jgi:hypothetical protein
MKTKFLRNTVLSFTALACSLALGSTQGSAQSIQQVRGFAAGHLQTVVFDGSTLEGWYSFPGQQPKLKFNGDQVRITSRRHSTVLLSRDADTSGSAAEVSLARAPISTSSISGLAVLSDAQHAMVIGLAAGNVVLWQLDPAGARMIARQQINADSPLEFRVSGGNAADVRFFWRHTGDGAWHRLGDSASNKVLSSWREPLKFGLLLDGPQGSQVTFSNYRAAASDMASNTMPGSYMTAALANGQ